MPNGFFHINRRKRIYDAHKTYEPYPHPDKFKATVDHVVYIIGIIGPLLGGVQAYKIWHLRDATGVSLSLFGFNMMFNLVWIMYGFLHRAKPLILMYTLWFIMNALVTIGVILYS